jgi:hypothetical protein
MSNTTQQLTPLTIDRVIVNIAEWEGPALPPGWIIVNAPRSLAGERTWTGDFRHGIFYAAGPDQLPAGGRERELAERVVASWAADDAWQVVFFDDAEIERRVLAKFTEYGYKDEDEAGVTIAEQAACMGLPWHGTDAQ